MSIKERLRDIRKIDSSIKIKKLEIENLQSMAIYKGVNMDPNQAGKGNGGRKNAHEDIIVKALDIENELNHQILDLIDRKEEALKMIDTLSESKMIDIFYMRYFEYRKWEDIALELGITFQWVHELHKRGLQELHKNFPSL